MTATTRLHTVEAGRERRPAFQLTEYEARIAATQQAMRERGIDGLLVHTPENICYLTGYETSGYFEYQVLVVPAAGEIRLLVRSVERLNVDEYTWLPGAHVWADGDDYLDLTRQLVTDLVDGRRIAIEKHSWFVTAEVAEALAELLPQHQLVPANRLVERLRLVKSDAELVYITEAAELADIATAAAVEAAGEGGNELDVAAAAYAAQIAQGGEYPALPHYVSSGSRRELGHAHWTDRTLTRGTLMKLEFLGTKRRYHAGLTRPLSIGPPTPDMNRSVTACIRRQDRVLDGLAPGVVAGALAQQARIEAEKAGQPSLRIRLGYSMGIGFPPIAGEGQTADFREGATWEVKPGMVFHMLSVASVGLVVSDTVAVTESGHCRLTRTPRELLAA